MIKEGTWLEQIYLDLKVKKLLPFFLSTPYKYYHFKTTTTTATTTAAYYYYYYYYTVHCTLWY